MKRIISMLLAIIAAATFVFGQIENKTNDEVARELGEFERDLTTARLNRDTNWLERFFAGKFTVVPSAQDETIKDRASEIAVMVERAVPTESLTPRDVKVRITGNIFVLGANAAEDANPMYYFLDTFNKHNGKWEVIATSFSSVSEPSGAETVEQTVLRIEREWNDALVKNDAAALNRIFADDYVLTNSLGEVKTKAVSLADVGEGKTTYQANVLDDVKVRVFGDTAVLTGQLTAKGKFAGQENGVQYRTTHVYVKRQGRWQVVANQMTAVARQ